ncbi:CRISPR-associated protein Cas4 [Thermincola ferriacetica]
MQVWVSNYGSFLGKKSERLVVKENNKICIVYAEFNDDRLIVTKDIHIIDDELRQWFIEERDEKMRMIYEEIDPGLANKCPENCPHLAVCCG